MLVLDLAGDFLDQILNPSKQINEQFAPVVVTLNDGSVVSGVVVNLSGDGVTLNTDLTDPNQRVNVDRKTVKTMEVSKVSRNSCAVGFGMTLVCTMSFSLGNCASTGPSCISDEP